MTSPSQSILCARCKTPTTVLHDSTRHFAKCEVHGDLTAWEVLGA